MFGTKVDSNVPTQLCTACEALWYDGADLETAGVALPEPTRVSDGSLACPRCGADAPSMRELLYEFAKGTPPTFSVFRCESCRGVWLDAMSFQASLMQAAMGGGIHKSEA